MFRGLRQISIACRKCMYRVDHLLSHHNFIHRERESERNREGNDGEIDSESERGKEKKMRLARTHSERWAIANLV